MKRIVASFDRETDPTDLARARVNTLNSDLTNLHTIISKWNKQIEEHPDNDSLMNNIIDSSTYMHREIDKMLEHYYTSLYTSKI